MKNKRYSKDKFVLDKKKDARCRDMGHTPILNYLSLF